jgi:hydroxyacylglutathione hydrolase
MTIKQIYTGCLSQGAYYIESNGEAAIIDPLREVHFYLERAQLDKAKIKYIFETHFHADFVSGHVTLAKKTGAPIVFGPNATPTFDALIAQDGQEFKVGNITIIAIHTPGHTMESTTYLLRDENGQDNAIFSGDTLFLGDVGRPDLAQKMGVLTEKDLAGFLFDSLREKIMPLADSVIVYPAHGAGSACGKNMMKQTVDTLGNQKKMNYALRATMTKQEFIEEVTQGLLPPPQYFPLNVSMNKHGYEDSSEVLKRGTKELSPEAFEAIANQTGAIILDVRHQDAFAKGHIPRAIFIGLDGGFAPWVGALIADVKQPLLLITEPGQEQEAVTRLSRVGFDNTLGYLKGGFDAWKKTAREYDTVCSITADTYMQEQKENLNPVFDVRKHTEFLSEHLEDAINTPLDSINEHLKNLPEENIFYIHCAGGYRSMIAASILKSRGIHNIKNIKGGFTALKESGIKISEFVCPSTL